MPYKDSHTHARLKPFDDAIHWDRNMFWCRWCVCVCVCLTRLSQPIALFLVNNIINEQIRPFSLIPNCLFIHRLRSLWWQLIQHFQTISMKINIIFNLSLFKEHIIIQNTSCWNTVYRKFLITFCIIWLSMQALILIDNMFYDLNVEFVKKNQVFVLFKRWTNTLKGRESC